jgi:hypothetical protein
MDGGHVLREKCQHSVEKIKTFDFSQFQDTIVPVWKEEYSTVRQILLPKSEITAPVLFKHRFTSGSRGEESYILVTIMPRIIRRIVVELTEQPSLLSRSPSHESPASPSRTSHGNRVAS